MQTAERVRDLIAQYTAEGLTAPEIITRIAPECVGWPYVFGAWGEACTPSNRKRRVRDDHPTIKSACPALNGKSCADCKWGIGVLMYDCRGFTAWLLRQVGLDLIGGGATGQWNDSRNWVQKGEISTMPDCVCCLFRKKDNKMEHTGMHIGNGRVIHCSRNVEESGMSGWTHYAIPVGLYDEIPGGSVRRTLKRGSQGADVHELQTMLTARGFDCGKVDGVFGKATESAVKAFQKANGLTVDGIVGRATWAILDAPMMHYTITISGANQAQLNQIKAICPQAVATEEGVEDAGMGV